MILSHIHLAFELWDKQGEAGHLEQVYDDVLGRVNWEESQGTDVGEPFKMLQEMIEGHGGFDMLI